MSTALERLFALEIEFHRLLRLARDGGSDPGGLHTSWALGHDYAGLIASLNGATADDLATIAERIDPQADPRDSASARDVVARWLRNRR